MRAGENGARREQSGPQNEKPQSQCKIATTWALAIPSRTTGMALLQYLHPRVQTRARRKQRVCHGFGFVVKEAKEEERQLHSDHCESGASFVRDVTHEELQAVFEWLNIDWHGPTRKHSFTIINE